MPPVLKHETNIKRTPAQPRGNERRRSHPCEGRCGRNVSANKAKCLECQAKEAVARLACEGVFVSHEEAMRGIRYQTRGADQSA
jgi:hypothetical protein